MPKNNFDRVWKVINIYIFIYVCFSLQLFPYSFALYIPEFIILYIYGKRLPQFEDTMCSFLCLLMIFLPV